MWGLVLDRGISATFTFHVLMSTLRWKFSGLYMIVLPTSLGGYNVAIK
jgi:hypothetical protein